MSASVLIVSEDLSFLVTCYAGLRRDERIGRVEATTSQEEAALLVQVLHPDAVVFDSSAGGIFGISSIGQLRELAPRSTVVVTFRDRERQTIELAARRVGVQDVVSRGMFSADRLLRAIHGRRVAYDHAPACDASA